MSEKGLPTYGIDLAGKHYNLAFAQEDIDPIEIACQAASLGSGRASIFQLIDPPYNHREIRILLHFGINGARKQAGRKDLVSDDDINKILADHTKYLMKTAKGVKAWQEAHSNMYKQLYTAVRLSVGLVDDEPEGTGLPKSEESPGLTQEP